MMYPSIFCVILAATSAQLSPQHLLVPDNFGHGHRRSLKKSLKKGETVIENKNVNIIVNVDPKEVAQELWKVVEAHLNKKSQRRTMIEQNATEDLEKIVTSLLMPTRRGVPAPSAFKVAHNFEQVARRAVSTDMFERNTLDKEILVRDIVADLMVSMRRMIVAGESYVEEPWNHKVVNRRMLPKSVSDDDDYVDIRIKMRRRDLLNVLY